MAKYTNIEGIIVKTDNYPEPYMFDALRRKIKASRKAGKLVGIEVYQHPDGDGEGLDVSDIENDVLYQYEILSRDQNGKIKEIEYIGSAK